MMRYNWQNPKWPQFEYDTTPLQETLYRYAQEVSTLKGALDQLPKESIQNATIDLMVLEALKTSEIEGELFYEEDVRSSIRMNLGLPYPDLPSPDIRAKGIADVMIDVHRTYDEPLTKETLYRWQALILPDIEGRGAWRQNKEPMQIVAGPIGRERVYFEAPPSHQLDKEMDGFIDWFNKTQPTPQSTPLPGPIRAAIAHLYFESIHPFIDGNGRIGRAISEKALSQDIGSPVLYSLSNTIQRHRKEYYNTLHLCSGYSLNISEWVQFFSKCVYIAQQDSKDQITFILKKSKFWNDHSSHLNERQHKVIARMFEEGPGGFKGGMTAKKYMSIADCSKATATRDLTDLLEKGCFTRLPGDGPNTRYDIHL